jgi:hypothetical protein
LTDFSEENIAPIFTVEEYAMQETTACCLPHDCLFLGLLLDFEGEGDMFF